jgi:glycosyltransferase involved in cell wall biosynthesis
VNYLIAVDTFFPDGPGGMARVAWDIAQVMRDCGNSVAMLCRKQTPDADDVSEYEGIKVVRFSFPESCSLDPFKMRRRVRAGMIAAQKYLTDKIWDLIHIHLPLYGKIVYEVFGDRPRYVYTVHSPAVMEQRINWAAQGLTGKVKLLFGTGTLKKLEGGILRRVDKIHTLSQFAKQAIDRFYSVGDKVTVIPHWCRENFTREYSKRRAREELCWPQDAKILFSVRFIHVRYGLDIAIKAVELGIADNVWFLGRVSDETLRRCYEAADLFVLPTIALECFGLIVLEAFAYGLPVISTDAAALPELMEPILPQCVVPAGNVERLREKIKSFLEGKLSLPSGEVLKKYVSERFGAETVTKRLTAFLGS